MRALAALLLWLVASPALAQTLTVSPSGGGSGTPGALTKISAQTVATASSIDFTALGTTYRTLLLSCDGIRPSAAGVALYLVLGTGASPTWQSSGYEWVSNYNNTSSAAITTISNASDTQISLTPAALGTALALDNSSFWAVIQNFGQSTQLSQVQFWGGFTDNGAQDDNWFSGVGDWGTVGAALTSVRVIMSGAATITGHCAIYGLTP